SCPRESRPSGELQDAANPECAMTSAPVAAKTGAMRSSILAWFPHLDKLLKNAVSRARQLYRNEGEEAFRGLYISEQEVDALMDCTETVGAPGAAAEFLNCCESLPEIEGFSHYWQLSPFDHGAMLLALAPEVDLRYERIYAYLQDDVTRRKPSADLTLT